jgi:hypothetical protein
VFRFCGTKNYSYLLWQIKRFRIQACL